MDKNYEDGKSDLPPTKDLIPAFSDFVNEKEEKEKKISLYDYVDDAPNDFEIDDSDSNEESSEVDDDDDDKIEDFQDTKEDDMNKDKEENDEEEKNEETVDKDETDGKEISEETSEEADQKAQEKVKEFLSILSFKYDDNKKRWVDASTPANKAINAGKCQEFLDYINNNILPEGKALDFMIFVSVIGDFYNYLQGKDISVDSLKNYFTDLLIELEVKDSVRAFVNAIVYRHENIEEKAGKLQKCLVENHMLPEGKEFSVDDIVQHQDKFKIIYDAYEDKDRISKDLLADRFLNLYNEFHPTEINIDIPENQIENEVLNENTKFDTRVNVEKNEPNKLEQYKIDKTNSFSKSINKIRKKLIEIGQTIKYRVEYRKANSDLEVLKDNINEITEDFMGKVKEIQKNYSNLCYEEKTPNVGRERLEDIFKLKKNLEGEYVSWTKKYEEDCNEKIKEFKEKYNIKGDIDVNSEASKMKFSAGVLDKIEKVQNYQKDIKKTSENIVNSEDKNILVAYEFNESKKSEKSNESNGSNKQPINKIKKLSYNSNKKMGKTKKKNQCKTK